ncbi:hypothetical protein [Sphingobacterium sp. SGR-19]|uniref:hypothetical protein n=1 Tax=Sphingobacterium sp. SGR-19 TaxID=2710886 RepID=UPI0013EC54EF|nr:hypothetical protein [Sphingobacterium sp. SGR-19]NGM64059.1 hypothetical protein [Sphingobacterium sp. SGR-19]
MIRIILYFTVGVLVSFYLFPIGFMFLPNTLNTKMILGVLGGMLFGYNSIQSRGISMPKGLLGAFGLTVLFSLVCYIAVDVNNTADYSYVTYTGSFFAWLAGAYLVCMAIKAVHGQATFRFLVLYLATVCFTQCILALLIDNIESFKILVNSYVNQGQSFYEEKDRLYGIGAALDSAGVRFSVVLVTIVALICHEQQVRRSTLTIVLLLLVFFTIAVVGNAISRTTIIGVGSAMLYFMLFSGLFRLEIRFSAMKLGVWFGITLLVAVGISTFLYYTNAEFYGHMRFAFEGFFNLVEHGKWKTASTDKLNSEMWIWPEDTKTWIIGSGLFGNYVYGTDIGYCRFILYSGVIGFAVFALFFIYNGYFFMRQSPKYAAMFLLFIAMTFVFWIKVATDIFFIYALFYCLDEFMEERTTIEPLVHEDRLLYS